MEKSYNKASICITSKIISAKEITSILKINPTVSHEKGTPLNPRVPNTIIRPESSWIVDSQTNEEEPLHIHIEELVSLIDKNINEFKKIIEVCKIEIYCGFFSAEKSGEFFLNSNLLKRLTTIPLDIIVILYPPADNSDDR